MSRSDHALVLAAGLGTRLRPLTLVRAKPALPLAGEPLIVRILRSLANRSVADVVINLHHLPASITSVVGDGADLGLRIRYSWEAPAVLGSAGGPRRARELIDAESFYIMNGDTLADVNLASLKSAHESSGALVTLALTPNREPSRYGGVVLDAGAVTGFVRRGSPTESLHFVGVQMARADAFDNVTPGRLVNSIGESYDQLIRTSPGSIRGFVCDTSFIDIGTPADYMAASRALTNGRSDYGAAIVDRTAHVSRSILWDDVVVGAGAVVDECIVTDGVRVEPGAVYHRAILIAGPDGRLNATPLPDANG